MRVRRRLDRIEHALGINLCSLCIPGGRYGYSVYYWPDGAARPVDDLGENLPDYCPECGRALFASEGGFRYVGIDPAVVLGAPVVK